MQHRNALDQFQHADKENNDRIVLLETELAKAKEEGTFRTETVDVILLMEQIVVLRCV